MQLVRELHIGNFRSIHDLRMRDLDGAVVLCGPNGAGKSNVLRALNLFFNDEVEPGVSLDLQRDFHKPKSKKTKSVRVGVHLDFSEDFHLHKSLKATAEKAGITEQTPPPMAIEKVWSIDPIDRSTTAVSWLVGPDLDHLDAPDADQQRFLSTLLQLIRFRYIPNHVHPTVILTSEQGEIRKELLARLKKRKAYQDYQKTVGGPLFAELANVSRDVVLTITSRLRAGKAVDRLELQTPSELSELVWEFAMLLRTPSGDSFGSLMHGSGTQAHLMYLLLDFLDNSFGNTFGWRQAVIWAIEEPESFLHSDLQAEVARFFAERSADRRLQILLTTHNPAFMMAADAGHFIDIEGGVTTHRALKSRELIEVGFRQGASPFLHPLVMSSPRPLLLVEGESDKEYIQLAYELRARRCPWLVQTLRDLDPTAGGDGGVDTLIRYLDVNRLAIAGRASSSPIDVLVDWEVSPQKVDSLGSSLSSHPASGAMSMPEKHANPDLGTSISGIERYLSTSVWREVLDGHALPYTRPHDSEFPITMQKGPLAQAKPHLRKAVHRRRDPEDLTYLMRVLDELEAARPG